MAGSIDVFLYESDNENTYVIRADKSNTNLINDVTARPDGTEVFLPRNITPRYFLYRSADGRTQRKLYLLSPEDPDTAPATVSVNNALGATEVLSKSFYSGEKIAYIPTFDTGLNDETGGG